MNTESDKLICYKCKEYKEQDKFYNSKSEKTKYRSYKHGYCIACTSDHNHSRKEYLADRHLRNTYGISLQDKRDMIKAQENKCAICATEVTEQSHLDHCHTAGAIRGVLCFRCNSVLGKLGDNKTLLLNMVKYLEEYE